jgi:DNA-binding LytR/AlgR family response regulator
MVIKKCVERTEALELVALCSSALEARELLKTESIDLILLDVEMPEMSGIDFLQSMKIDPKVILITSKTDYAVEAFEHDVVDYILKPVNYPRFIKAIEKAQGSEEIVQIDTAGSDHMFIKIDHKLVRIILADIMYIEALADYVIVHTADARYTVLSTMKAMETKLPPKLFARTHRSFIIRLDKILSIEENVVTLASKSIPISRSYKANIMQRLNLL